MLHLQAWQRQLLLPQDIGFAQLHKHFSLTKHLPGFLTEASVHKGRSTARDTAESLGCKIFSNPQKEHTHNVLFATALHHHPCRTIPHLTTNVTGRGLYLVSYMGWQDGELEASQARLCHPLAS